MKARKDSVKRKTRETDVSIEVNLDGKGKSSVKTGIGFLDHMLTLFSKHGLFDLKIKVKGDLEVDIHHTNEDVGIVLGLAFKKALSSRKGIQRYGDAVVPMDGSLVRAAVDISNRPSLHMHNKIKRGLENQLYKTMTKRKGKGYSFVYAEQFVSAFVMNAGINTHIEILAFDRDIHHLLEAMFKAMGRALSVAVIKNPRVKGVPSTKGKL